MITVVNKSDKAARFSCEDEAGACVDHVLEPGKTCKVPEYMAAQRYGGSILSMLTGGRVVVQKEVAAPVVAAPVADVQPAKLEKKGK